MVYTLAAASDHVKNAISHVEPHGVFGTQWLTNLMVLSLLAAVLVYAMFHYVARRMWASDSSAEAHVTKGPLAQIGEAVCAFIRDNVARPQLGNKTDRYIYYVWTVFFFVLFCNLLGMIPFGAMFGLLASIPGLGFIDTIGLTHMSGTPTSNLGVTGPLALISFLAVIGIGLYEDGPAYFKHFAPVPFKPLPANPIGKILHPVLAGFLVFMEGLSLIIKCCVLAMRLFGTMAAGHVALGVLLALAFILQAGAFGYLIGLGSVAAATALGLLELFIALIQAFIFTFLTVIFIASGLHGEHDEHHDYDKDYEGEPEHGIEPVAHGAA
jgi:F-type H+-transporting ATPase subunit a